jgi:hypothetical protein
MKKILMVIGVFLVGVLALLLGQKDYFEMGHHLDEKNCYTAACHTKEQGIIKEDALEKNCIAYCSQTDCHPNRNEHHRVAVALPAKSGLPLYLGQNNMVVCATCHNLANSRYDTKPWRSMSLFGRVFKQAKKYPTYYLIINNIKGQLCKQCH